MPTSSLCTMLGRRLLGCSLMGNGAAALSTASTAQLRPFSNSTSLNAANNIGSSSAGEQASMDEAERAIAQKLQDGLAVRSVVVRDTSGGCGEFYTIDVVADEFKGVSLVKQHQLVHKLLADDVRKWHGLNLTTKAP